MPNWCEGSLKLRGDPMDILRFIQEGLNVYDGPAWSETIDKSKWLEIIDADNELEIYFNHETIYVEDTKRAFINLAFSKMHTDGIALKKDGEDEVAVFAISQAWGFREEDWIEIAKKYNLDIRLTGIEQGMGFMEDLIITKDGEVTDLSPSYENYDDFRWNCPIPFIGG